MVRQIGGLSYLREYLNVAEQGELLALVDQQQWLADLKRRVQQYGYRYDYTRRHAGPADYLGPLPAWAAALAQRLHHEGHIGQIPDQVLVNEYQPGQGISSHIDCVPCFGDTVLSLSLASRCIMLFTHRATRERVELLLEPGSLLVMRGEARYEWKHGIPARKADTYDGLAMPRGRRVSLTLRTVTAPATGAALG
jgi:alkylated DNA repair dioxygenase AlkB